MPVVRKQFFPFTVHIDDEPIPLRIKRMTVLQFEAFNAEFRAHAHGRGAPTETDNETPDAALARLTAEVEYLKANAEWMLDVFEQYVSVAAGELFDEDESGEQVEVTNGRQFAEMFAGQDVLRTVLMQILLENALTEGQKKKLLSRSASPTGSPTEPSTEAAGETPEPIAESAAPEASAAVEDATVRLSDESSGTTAH